jgi:hypothetical protein
VPKMTTTRNDGGSRQSHDGGGADLTECRSWRRRPTEDPTATATSRGHGRLIEEDDDILGEELDSGSGGSCRKRTRRGSRSPAASDGNKLHDEEANQGRTWRKNCMKCGVQDQGERGMNHNPNLWLCIPC